MKEAIEQEIDFLRAQIAAQRRIANIVNRQIDFLETRIDALRMVIEPPPWSAPGE